VSDETAKENYIYNLTLVIWKCLLCILSNCINIFLRRGAQCFQGWAKSAPPPPLHKCSCTHLALWYYIGLQSIQYSYTGAEIILSWIGFWWRQESKRDGTKQGPRPRPQNWTGRAWTSQMTQTELNKKVTSGWITNMYLECLKKFCLFFEAHVHVFKIFRMPFKLLFTLLCEYDTH